MKQWALREDTPRPPVIYGAWPDEEDIQKGQPASPLTWEQLVAIRRAEDELRTKRASASYDGIGRGWANTLTGDYYLAFKPSNPLTRVPIPAGAFGSRFSRARSQYSCGCQLCDRMEKWWANPKPTHLEPRVPLTRDSLGENMAERLVDQDREE